MEATTGPSRWRVQTKLTHDFIKHTLDASKDCVVEIIFKDTDTWGNKPKRFTEWSRIVGELIEQSGNGYNPTRGSE
jgi:hypothetical protein